MMEAMDRIELIGRSEDNRRINQLVSHTANDRVRPFINPTTLNISFAELLIMVVTVQEGISKPYADNNLGEVRSG